MGKIKDLTGRQFGQWEVFQLSFTRNRKTYYACRCGDCGKVFDVRSDHLIRHETSRYMKCAAYERIYGYASII